MVEERKRIGWGQVHFYVKLTVHVVRPLARPLRLSPHFFYFFHFLESKTQLFFHYWSSHTTAGVVRENGPAEVHRALAEHPSPYVTSLLICHRRLLIPIQQRIRRESRLPRLSFERHITLTPNLFYGFCILSPPTRFPRSGIKLLSSLCDWFQNIGLHCQQTKSQRFVRSFYNPPWTSKNPLSDTVRHA